MQKVNAGDQSIFFIVLRSSTLPLSTIDEIAQTSRPAHFDGQRRGAGERVRVAEACRAHRRRPARAGRASIGIDEVATAIQNANANLPTGTIYGERVCRADQRAADAGVGVRPTIVSYRNGNPVHLNEVAHVYDGVENDKNGELAERRALRLSVDPEAAGHQRRADGGRDQGAAPGDPCPIASLGHARRPQRSRRHHPRVGGRREADAGDRDRRWWCSSSSCSSEHLRDAHSQPGAARVAARHVHGDVLLGYAWTTCR